MAFSHIHFDHVGVANEVKNATWLVQEADFDAAFLPEGEPLGTCCSNQTYCANLKTLRHKSSMAITMYLVTVAFALYPRRDTRQGHQVLFVDLTEYGPLVLSGDLYHFRFSRAQRRVPLFNVNADQTLASMDKVESLVTEEGAQFWIEHDLALFNTLKTAPDFYR